MKDFLIKIRTLFERKGADEAKTTLKETGDAAATAAPKADDLDKALDLDAAPAAEAAKEVREVGDAAEQAEADLESLGTTGEQAIRKTSRGAKQAAADLRKTGEVAQAAAAKAETTRFDRFFGGIQNGAKKATNGVTGLFSAMKSLAGLAIVGTITMFARSLMQASQEATRNAKAVGLISESWQELEFTAKQTKVEVNDLRDALNEINLRATQTPEKFEKLSIATKDTSGAQRDAKALLYDVADAMRNAADAGQRTTIANDLLGGSGWKLIPMLEQGSAKLDEFAQAAHDAGQVLDEQATERLNAASAALDRLQRRAIVAGGEFVMMAEDLATAAKSGTIDDELIKARQQAAKELGVEIGLFGRLKTDATTRALIEGRTKDILTKQAAAKVEQNILDEQAAKAAEKRAKQAEAKAALEERLANQLAVTEALAKAEADHARAKLPLTEQLALIEKDIAAAKTAAAQSGEKERLAHLNELLRARYALEEAITKEKADQKKQEEETAKSQAERKADLEAEYRILEARAAGSESLATQLEEERDIRAETKRIAEETGTTEAQAEAFLRRKLDLEKQIAAEKKGQTEEAKKQQTEEERLLEIARKDIEGRSVEGRQARDKLIQSGTLSRDQNERERQLLDTSGESARTGDDRSRARPGIGGKPSITVHGEERPVSAPQSPVVEALPDYDNTRLLASLERQGRAITDFARSVEQRDQGIVSRVDQVTRQVENLARDLGRLTTEVRRNR